VRALYSTYAGPLYTVVRASDDTTTSIPLLTPGGYANASAQDAFCAGTDCTVSVIFDQTVNGNDLGVFNYSDKQHDRAANASVDPHQVGGHKVYSLYTEPGVGYRSKPGAGKGVAVGDEPETICEW
jgi:hypothetical protein